jgi:hypothetical protein
MPGSSCQLTHSEQHWASLIHGVTQVPLLRRVWPHPHSEHVPLQQVWPAGHGHVPPQPSLAPQRLPAQTCVMVVGVHVAFRRFPRRSFRRRPLPCLCRFFRRLRRPLPSASSGKRLSRRPPKIGGAARRPSSLRRLPLVKRVRESASKCRESMLQQSPAHPGQFSNNTMCHM